MKKAGELFRRAACFFQHSSIRTIVLVLVLMLFVFGAAAPNATIGIGK